MNSARGLTPFRIRARLAVLDRRAGELEREGFDKNAAQRAAYLEVVTGAHHKEVERLAREYRGTRRAVRS